MNRHSILLFFLVSLFACTAKTDSDHTADSLSLVSEGEKTTSVTVESISFGDKGSIPHVVDPASENNPAVKAINDAILERFMIESFDPKTADFSWGDVSFTHGLDNNMVEIHFDGDYIGSYPTHISETMVFDLNTGAAVAEPKVPWHLLFSPMGFLDFWTKHWITNCERQIDEAVKCADGNDPSCGCSDIQLSAEAQKIVFAIQGDCYPHALAACSPSYTVAGEGWLDPMLSPLGQKLVSSAYFQMSALQKINQYDAITSDTPLPKNCFIYGAIDGKYKFAMALEFKENSAGSGEVTGAYSYTKYKTPIALKGTYTPEGITLGELSNGEVIGNFAFAFAGPGEETDCSKPVGGRALNVQWTNAKTSKTMPVCLNFVLFTSEVFPSGN